MIARVCPKCRSTNVHRSHRRGSEHLMTIFLMRPFRCHNCKHRYWGLLFSESIDPIAKLHHGHHHDDDVTAEDVSIPVGPRDAD